MTTIEKPAMVLPADNIHGREQGQWKYVDYAALPDDGMRYEVMNGVLLMAPSPSPAHQSIIGRIFVHLFQCVDSMGLGHVFLAPLDVELAENRVVQPDILVLLNKSLNKLTSSRVVGAPDLVIEVTSPGTAVYDRLTKFEAYAQAGVSEYWIVNPVTQTIEMLLLHSGTYHSKGVFHGTDTLPSQIVSGMGSVQVEQYFVL